MNEAADPAKVDGTPSPGPSVERRSADPDGSLASGPWLLSVQNLIVEYGPIIAVQHLSLFVAEGEIVALLGANGAGKSSTLNTIVGLIPSSAGSVRLRGTEIRGLRTEAIVRRGVTLVPEGRHIFGDLTVKENLHLGAGTRGRRAFSGELADTLDLFPVLRDRLHARAGLLSGGEQQMLAIARALMCRPQLLLLDEPSLGLAPKIVDRVFALIRELRTRGVTILLVEQNVERALETADRAYVLSSGRLETSGTVETLPAEEIERAYLGLSAPGRR